MTQNSNIAVGMMNGRKSVLLLSPSLKGIGGVSTFSRLLMKHISPEFEIDHFQIANRLGNRSLVKQFLFFIQDARNLKKKLKNKNYDIIHLNPSFRILSLVRDSFYLSRISKFHADNILVMFHGWDGKLAERFGRNAVLCRLFKRTYQKAQLILVLSQPSNQQLEKLGILPAKIDIITTMYQEDFASDGSEEDRDNRPISFLFIARLIKTKGPYIAAEVVKRLAKNGYKNFRFIFAGEGPAFEGLKRFFKKHRLEDYVLMAGNILGEEKKTILKESDIFLLPSLSEGCPVSMLEAMGAGLAVVASSVGAIPDIIEPGKNGFLVDSNEPQLFYEAVVRLIEDRDLLKKIQSLNREKAKEKYEARIVTKKFESVYLSVVNG